MPKVTPAVQPAETEEAKRNREMVEEIAKNISSLSGAVKVLLGGKLNKKAVTLLLAHSSGLYQHQVEKLLEALENLEKDWIKK